MILLPNLSDTEFATLTNALRAAADKFRENAKAFRALKPQLIQEERLHPNRIALMHSSACQPLAEQFDLQAREAEALLEKIEESAADA